MLPGTVLGSEGVGTIQVVGTDCSLSIGQRVVVIPTYRHGTWAGHTDVEERDLVAVPDSVSDDQAAFAGVNPLTALALLDDIEPGAWIIQNAANAASARNIAAVAASRSIRVVNVVRRTEAADTFGPDEHVVVDHGDTYRNQVAAITGNEPIQYGIDVHGGSATSRLIECVTDGGNISVYGAVSSEPLQAWAPHLIFRGITIRGFWLLPWINTKPDSTIQSAYQSVFDLITADRLSTQISTRFVLSEHVVAIRAATTPARTGKVVFALDTGRF